MFPLFALTECQRRRRLASLPAACGSERHCRRADTAGGGWRRAAARRAAEGGTEGREGPEEVRVAKHHRLVKHSLLSGQPGKQSRLRSKHGRRDPPRHRDTAQNPSPPATGGQTGITGHHPTVSGSPAGRTGAGDGRQQDSGRPATDSAADPVIAGARHVQSAHVACRTDRQTDRPAAVTPPRPG